MVTLAIQLPDEQAKRLTALASRLKLSAEELATAQVLELLAKPDERLEQATQNVLSKNADLYRRLRRPHGS